MKLLTNVNQHPLNIFRYTGMAEKSHEPGKKDFNRNADVSIFYLNWPLLLNDFSAMPLYRKFLSTQGPTKYTDFGSFIIKRTAPSFRLTS